MTNMGYVTPFTIMVIALLSMQFATSNGTLICMASKYALCYTTLISQAVTSEQCTADGAIQCLQNTANECDINNSTNAGAMGKVLEMEQILDDLCKTGSDMNKAFLKHKGCVFGATVNQANTQCYLKLAEALLKYQKTGNIEKDTNALFKIACPYTADVKKCVIATVKDNCGEDASKFHRKLSNPANDLEEMACNSSPALIGKFWTVLLQASVILMSLHFFRLKE